MNSPDLLPIEGTEVALVEGLPANLPGALRLGDFAQARRDDLLVRIPGIGAFRARDGIRLEIEPAAGLTLENALHSCVTPFGGLVHQRNELPLHASAVCPFSGGPALLIAGPSGSGKSTTAAAFAQHGWKVMNDDISRISITGQDALVWGGMTSLKLSPASCALLNLEAFGFRSVSCLTDKRLWAQQAETGACPIAGIVELVTPGETFRVAGLSCAEAFRLLLRQTFRRYLVGPLGHNLSHFGLVKSLAMKVPCFVVDRGDQLSPSAFACRLQRLVL